VKLAATLDLEGGVDEQIFVAGRAMRNGATDLMMPFGSEAVLEAAHRADASRGGGSVVHFCRCRQVERLIVLLDGHAGVGSLH
jgi:putative hemolysin